MTGAMPEMSELFSALMRAGMADEIQRRMIMRTAARIKGRDVADLATACCDLAVNGWTVRQVQYACS